MRIETTLAIWQLVGSYCATAGPVPALVGMLLHPEGRWRRQVVELALPIAQNPASALAALATDVAADV